MKRLDALKENVDAPPRPLIDALLQLDNGHSVLNHLTEDFDEAARLYALNPVRQAIELAKLSERLKAKAAAPVTKRQLSRAPAPLNPISGGAKTISNAQPSDTDDDESWFAKRAATRRAPRYL
jgi:hypothetical protein